MNILKSIKLMLLGAVAISTIYASEAPAPALPASAPVKESFWPYVPGAFWMILKGTYQAGAWTVNTAGQTISSAFNYFNPKTQAFIVAAGSLPIILKATHYGWSRYNASPLYPLREKLRQANQQMGDELGSEIKLNRWQYRRYPNASNIVDNKDLILQEFINDYSQGRLKLGEDSYSFAGGILLGSGRTKYFPTGKDIQDRIAQELKELREDIKFVETNYTKYFGFDRQILWYTPGVKKVLREDYHREIVAGDEIIIDAPASWTKGQAVQMNRIVLKELAQNAWWQKVIMPNYALAVATWWELNLRYSRLLELRRVLELGLILDDGAPRIKNVSHPLVVQVRR